MAKIFFIGYMGSGKSTVGKKLAAKLGYDFIDLDKLIETEYQQTIPEIFSTKGEKEFRSMEHNTLKKLLEKHYPGCKMTGVTGTNSMEPTIDDGHKVVLIPFKELEKSKIISAK